jgi:hypothetical protein
MTKDLVIMVKMVGETVSVLMNLLGFISLHGRRE